MTPEDFVNLHVHSHYSLLEALPSPKKLVAHTLEQGGKAIALTDNGSMYGAVEFYKACKKAEIKPIIGLDAFIAVHGMHLKRSRLDGRPHRATLLARNDDGYKNILKITTAGFLEGFYYKPRVDMEFMKSHGKGVTVLSGGPKGQIPSALSMDDHEKAESILREWQQIVGEENFYLELIHHPDYARQVELNEKLIEFGKKTGAPLIVTRNSFYIKSEDKEGYEAQLCIQRGRTLERFRQTNPMDVDLSMCSNQEIFDAYKHIPEAIMNTKKVADSVTFEMDLGNNYLPIFPMPPGKTDDDYLHDLTLAGLKVRYGNDLSEEVLERFEYEFGVIKNMGFASYFIIVQDFVNWAKDQGILVGPGRGSAAGSIISYALKITDIDPLKYGLLFERFLNPDRISMPDVDLDFTDTRRGEVLGYVTEKYGADHVAGIITFGTMMPRAAVRDAARVLGLEYDEADLIAKTVPPPVQGRHTPLGIAIKEDPELKQLYNGQAMARRVIDLAMKIEGNPRHASQHACGFVVGDKPLVERAPLQAGQREDTALVTQYSLNSAEAAGLVKMDFLGLSNLTVIQDAIKVIKAVYGDTVVVEDIPLEDKKTFELLGRGDTTGVFQLESDGMKRYIRELKPTVFEDIIAMVALYRPGPMQFIESFIARKHGKEKIEYEHPKMENSFKETYGIPVYQEQVMQISKEMAGFTGGEADTLRKAMGKKIVELMAKMKVKFIAGSVENGVPKRIAEEIFQKLEDFAAYGFNKSHAACYGTIAYWTAYLKAHYPSAFMAALMNSDAGNIDRITIEVEECRRLGIEVLPPDVNESFPSFAVVPETGNIRWGLRAIKNYGDEVAKVLVQERKENGDFVDLVDFLSRVPASALNKKALEALTKSGAIDRFEERECLVTNLDQMLLFTKQISKEKEQNQVSMFDMAPAMQDSKLRLREVKEPISKGELMAWEKELLGIYVSNHPGKILSETLGDLTVKTSAVQGLENQSMTQVAGVIGTVKKILTKKHQKPMAFVKLEDGAGELEIVVFPKIFAEIQHQLIEGKLTLIAGKVSVRDGDEGRRSILCDQLLSFEESDTPIVKSALKRGMWPSLEDGENEIMNPFVMQGVSIVVPQKPTPDMITNLQALLKANPGKERVYLVVRSGERSRKVQTEYLIDPDGEVIASIQEIVGKQNVMFSR